MRRPTTSALVAFAIVFAACGRDATTPLATADDLAADVVVDGAEFKLLSDGILTAVLRADSAFGHDADGRYDLKGVDAVFYTEQGAEAGTLTSESGDYDMSNGLFIARDDVVLITEGPNGPRRLETDELSFAVQEDRIWTDSEFTLLEAGRTTLGTSFRTDSKFRTWEVTGARTRGTVSDDQDLEF